MKPRWESELSLEEVFAKLGLGPDQAAAFTSLGITITELEACTEDDLKVVLLLVRYLLRLVYDI